MFFNSFIRVVLADIGSVERNDLYFQLQECMSITGSHSISKIVSRFMLP